MSPNIILLIILGYFGLLMTVSFFTRNKSESNEAFFSANHSSPWFLVAFGMIGATISGVSLVSVPGMVLSSQWSYLQTCIGFFFGYIVVAFILLPLYYKLGLTSIYQYIEQRFGNRSHKTASVYFVLAKLISSASKLYIVVMMLQLFVFDYFGVPFELTALGAVIMIWIYTKDCGIKTIVWTDTLQTFFMVTSIVVIAIYALKMLNVDNPLQEVISADYSRIWFFDSWSSPYNFFKQFFSGIFIVVVMTGLDQDMMQKNLTCKTLKDSRKNMLWYGTAFLPVNILLLLIGSSILLYVNREALTLPNAPDTILPWFTDLYMPNFVVVFFLLGVISASFSSADSALTSITTTISVDVFDVEKVNHKDAVKIRKYVHFAVAILFSMLVICFDFISNKSILDTIYTIVGYAYGPLLGMFSFGLLTKKNVRDNIIPYISIVAPILCYVIQWFCLKRYNYHFGYELLMLNGIIMFIGMYISGIGMVKKKEVLYDSEKR